ncbi:MAG: PEGA domain-containing protein [Desulfobacteraceae bacterium]|nr:MAG: PEGA domain-containing protein [Desulfobacteraceae bacterium]
MKKYYPKGNDGKAEKKPVRIRIEPNQLIAKRYLTKFEIRKDAMINVHMAFDRERDMNVSLMSIPSPLLKNPDLLADLKVELSAASKLNHNNITRLYSIDTWNKISFAVMEYVPGHTLAAHLEEKGGKLGPDESIALLRQIANGLDYAHTRPAPLPHLGLKPQNILLTEDNLVKIADFGLANIVSSPAAGIPGREDPETLSYRAPEQISGNKVGPWTDIYSLAAIAYEMLSGKPPVEGEDLRSRIGGETVTKIDGLPDHVNDALLLALSKDPSDRPKSAGDFVAMIAGEKPVSKAGRQTARNGKKKPALLFGIIGVIVLLLLAGLGLFLSREKTPVRQQSPDAGRAIRQKTIPQKIAVEQKQKPLPITQTETVTPALPPAATSVTETTATASGKASIASVPGGAEVYLNGLQKGLTPVVIHDLAEGEYEVILKKEGFDLHTEKIMASSSGTAEVTAMLKPAYGALQIQSDPPGAEVFVDSIKSGVTPINLTQVKKGDHTVKLLKPGYDAWTKEIRITAGVQSELAATLSVAMGSISITSKPDDAMIYIEGIKHGKTPLMLKVEKGIRTIEIQKSGYEPWKQNVKIMAGDMIEIKAELIQSKGGLQVNSRPSEADVTISGKLLGKTPLFLKDIPLGKTTVEIRKDCYTGDSRTISIKSGILSKIDFSLKPDCGSLIVTSDPENAKWYMDDQYAGTTPGTMENVTGGKHTIRVIKDQYQEWKETHTVTPGKPITIAAKLKTLLPDPGATWREPVTGMEFIWIAGGCYNMGSPPNELGRDADEGPVHKACLDGFWIGKYEVTQGQWKKIMGKNPSFFNRKDDYPVDSISWNDVQFFMQNLSATSEGRFAYRLPSEAEWEYACKSGGQPERFAGGDRFNSLAWFKGNSNRTTHSVGEKAPNNVGLYDMSGNLSEWVEDNYSMDAYKLHGENNPVYTMSGPNRVIRGGNWNQDEKSCRSADRDFAPAEEKSKTIGFRLIRVR